MLEFVERNADTSDVPHYKSPKSRPILETTVLFWTAVAKEQFHQMIRESFWSDNIS